MKETIHVTIDGKRVGAIADRKQKALWVDAKPSQFDGAYTTLVDDELFSIAYLQRDPEHANLDAYYQNQGACPDCGGNCKPDDCWGD